VLERAKGREWIRKIEGRVWEESETPWLSASTRVKKEQINEERVRIRKEEMY